MEFHSGPVSELEPSQAYDLLVSAIIPRPVALVSTCDLSGTQNVAPISFIAPGGTQPLSLVLSITLDLSGERKQTLHNIESQGEFVANLVSREQFDEYWQQRDASDSSKLLFPSLVVKPMRLREALFAFECRLHQVVPHGNGPGSAQYVVGEVFAVSSGKVRPTGQIGRLDGRDYVDLHELERFTID